MSVGGHHPYALIALSKVHNHLPYHLQLGKLTPDDCNKIHKPSQMGHLVNPFFCLTK